MKKVLILGAGMVSKPMVDYLLNTGEIEVTLASRTLSKAEKIIGGTAHGKAKQLLIDNDKAVETLVKNSDLVVSLLPYTYHVKVAHLCLEHGKHLVTTSYVSEEMQRLDAKAQSQEILILNEIGLDPGIDHMSAMKIIHDVQQRGGKILAFKSYCGGLPAPEANDNPWGYKFSWSPVGVLKAGRNRARFLNDQNIVEIEGVDLFKNNWPVKIESLDLETYPNRDSIPYKKLYGIENTRTMYRGTLRYPGWSCAMLEINRLGLLSETDIGNLNGNSYRKIMCRIFELAETEDPQEFINQNVSEESKDEFIEKLKWLNLLSDHVLDKNVSTPIEFLSHIMLNKMAYAAGERDMIVLHHDFVAEFENKHEHITSTLIDYGRPGGDSSMARTVSLPAAIAAKLILKGKILERGVRIPVDKEIYMPVLQELERLEIVCKEKTEEVPLQVAALRVT